MQRDRLDVQKEDEIIERIADGVQRMPGRIVIDVSGHGIGIPPDEISHLFESFHRASNVGDIPGTGLGLAIVKSAVTIHGGTIEVFSSPENGTRCRVRLPNSLQA